MSQPRGRERWIAAGLAVAHTLVCAYRARIQSLTHDEAFAFSNFLNVSWHDLYFRYEPNNHLLFSILAKLSMTLFGDSESALRLPTVIAGFFLMLGVWRVLEAVESRTARWIAFAAFALDPFIFDFCVAARGYGLVMASLAWAIAAAMRGRGRLAGFLLGLAISANFAAAFAAVALACAVFLTSDGSWLRRVGRVLAMSIAAALPVAATCAGVLSIVRGYNFTAGLASPRQSIANLLYVSLHDSSRTGLFGTLAAAQTIGRLVLPVIFVFIAGATMLEWRRGERARLIPAIALAVACCALVAAHYLAGLNYPVDRTGLWLMLLFGLAWAMASGNAQNRTFLGVNLLLAAVLTIQFTTQFHTNLFGIWWYDRSTKQVALRLEEEVRGKEPGSISIGATWVNQPVLEYYRVRDHIAALEPVVRRIPTELSGHDYYVLNQNFETAQVTENRTVLFSDPIAGVALVK